MRHLYMYITMISQAISACGGCWTSIATHGKGRVFAGGGCKLNPLLNLSSGWLLAWGWGPALHTGRARSHMLASAEEFLQAAIFAESVAALDRLGGLVGMPRFCPQKRGDSLA